VVTGKGQLVMQMTTRNIRVACMKGPGLASSGRHAKIQKTTDSIEIGIDVREYLQQQAHAWTLQHEGGATMLVMDASALRFRGGLGGSASDAVREFLERTFSGLKDVIVVVSHGQASVPELRLHVQKDNCTPVSLLHAACCSAQVVISNVLSFQMGLRMSTLALCKAFVLYVRSRK
jgi:hypothetical protein